MFANIISSLQKYAGSWTVKETRKFTDEELAMVTSASVVPSQYGSSVCLMLTSGHKAYIPLSNDATAQNGDSVNLKDATLICLSKEGEDDIIRVKC